MYTTCIHCHANLAANEVIEHLPVGRRLAYDAAAGRLWVVCRQCERWNLSPLETRWEAIEEAERAFRGTPLRAATDNIALARLREGLELVRIGKPPEREMLAWRYGDQFGRRRRKYLAYSTAGFGLAVAIVGAQIAKGFGVTAFGVGALGMIGTTPLSLYSMYSSRRRLRRRVTVVDGPAGTPPIVMTQNAIDGVSLTVVKDEWMLGVPRVSDITGQVKDAVMLTGVEAQRALAVVLPHMNHAGASRWEVMRAVDLLGELPSAEALLREAARNRAAVEARMVRASEATLIQQLPAQLRVAMEMRLHATEETLALDGEMARLEARWREADEIAKIADGLFVPEAVEARLRELREGTGANPPR